MTSDVLLAKLGAITRCLERIRFVTKGDPAAVRNIDVQDIVVLNLQRAIQSALDLAAHLIAVRDWGLPDSLKNHFTILEQHGVLLPPLADRLRAMTGFRNIAIHDYQSLEPAILETIVAKHLGDLEDFSDAVRAAASSD
jgi:uncharacterized protein YutE (UPF0331/DUF86 family)